MHRKKFQIQFLFTGVSLHLQALGVRKSAFWFVWVFFLRYFEISFSPNYQLTFKTV